MADQTHYQNDHPEENHQTLGDEEEQAPETHQQPGQQVHEEEQFSKSKDEVLSTKQELSTHNHIDEVEKHDQFAQQAHPMKEREDLTLQVLHPELQNCESSACDTLDSKYEVINGSEAIADFVHSKDSLNRIAQEQDVMSEKDQEEQNPTEIINKPQQFPQQDVHLQTYHLQEHHQNQNEKDEQGTETHQAQQQHGEEGHQEEQSIEQTRSEDQVECKKQEVSADNHIDEEEKHNQFKQQAQPLKEREDETLQVLHPDTQSLESSAGETLESKYEMINGSEMITDNVHSSDNFNHIAREQDVMSEQGEEEKKTTEITQSQDVCNLLKLKPTSEVQQSLESNSEQKIKEEITKSPKRPSQPEVDIKQINMKRFQATFDEANMLKNDGNEYTRKGQYNEAINVYADALRLCHPIYLMECPLDLIDQFKQLNVNINNNLSLCYLNVGEYNECISFANQVLAVEERNTKALYRLATAYEKKDDLEEAFKTITKARQFERADQKIHEKYLQLKEDYQRQKEVHKKAQQEVFQKMFNAQKPNESKPSSTKQVEPQENQEEEVPTILPNVSTNSTVQKQQNVNAHYSAFASMAVISTAVTTLLSTQIRKYLLKEDALSANSLASTGIIGGGVFGFALSKKIWQKLAFGAASSGMMALLLLAKSRAQ